MRDRTNLFLSYRQSYAHHPNRIPRYGDFNTSPLANEERQGLMAEAEGFDGDNGDVVIEMASLRPRWLDVQVEVGELLNRIFLRMAELDKLHHKHLLPGFEDDSVRLKEKQEIEHLTDRITDLFRDARRLVKGLEITVHELKAQEKIGHSEELLVKNLQISLAARISDSSAVFRRKQTAYLKKLQAFAGFASPTPPAPRTSAPNSSILDAELDVSVANNAIQQTRQDQRIRTRTDDMTEMIEARGREIDQIARGIVQLAELFQEFQAMVIDQGTMLDRIDYNVEAMSENVGKAAKSLEVANKYQGASNKRKIILLLIIIIVGVVILLGLKLSRKSGVNGG